MSLSRLSDECAGMDAEFVFGPVKIEPDHDACSGGHTRPGLLGGWECSCPCHVEPTLADVPESQRHRVCSCRVANGRLHLRGADCEATQATPEAPKQARRSGVGS